MTSRLKARARTHSSAARRRPQPGARRASGRRRSSRPVAPHGTRPPTSAAAGTTARTWRAASRGVPGRWEDAGRDPDRPGHDDRRDGHGVRSPQIGSVPAGAVSATTTTSSSPITSTTTSPAQTISTAAQVRRGWLEPESERGGEVEGVAVLHVTAGRPGTRSTPRGRGRIQLGEGPLSRRCWRA